MQAELQKQKQRIEAAARKLEAEQRQAKADLEEQRKAAAAAARRQAEGQVPLAVPLFVAVCSPHMPRVSLLTARVRRRGAHRQSYCGTMAGVCYCDTSLS
jgi:hypothetical protein